MKKNLVFGVIAALAVAALASAQQAPVLPGLGKPAPAPSATPGAGAAGAPQGADAKDPWDAWVEEYFKVIKVRKEMAKRVDATHAYPDPRIPALMEVVNEDDEYLYLGNLPLEDPKSAGHHPWMLRQAEEARSVLVKDFYADKFLLENLENEVPPPFTDRIGFEERSQGLPKQGLWQMGFDVGDFDGDGRLDLVLSPARKGEAHPWILLNTPDGWKIWNDVKWPDIQFDYGDVKVADFDGDGNLDIAIAVHFKKAYVMYGNGKGDFTRFAELPWVNANTTSRAMVVADFNGDGRPDIAQLSELDVDMATGTQVDKGLIIVDLNLPSGWKASKAAFPPNLYGDHITAGDFNADGKPDILIASHKATNDSFVFLNKGDGSAFTRYRSNDFPWQPYLLGVAAASLDGKKPQQAIMGITQSVRLQRGEYYRAHAIVAYRLTDRRGKLLKKPERRLIYRDQAGDYNMFRALAVGDLDGDGRPDIVAVRASGEILVLLQASNGSFMVQRAPELNIGDPSPSSVMIHDLDGDGGMELIANFSDGGKTPGSVRVWKVVRKTAAQAPAKPAAK